jgi:hypothetical protein
MHDFGSLWPYLDAALEHFAGPAHAAELAAAQASFRQRTGEYEAGQPWYEERIRLFHDWFLFDHVLDCGEVPLARFVSERGAALTGAQRDVYGDLLRTGHRSVFEVCRLGSTVELFDRIGRARYQVAAEAGLAGLEPGELLDARLLGTGALLGLSRGLLVHPRPARAAIQALVEHAREAGARAPWDLVDLLARMKLAWDRADSPRVAAIYGPESYLYRDHRRALAAPATRP